MVLPARPEVIGTSAKEPGTSLWTVAGRQTTCSFCALSDQGYECHPSSFMSCIAMRTYRSMIICKVELVSKTASRDDKYRSNSIGSYLIKILWKVLLRTIAGEKRRVSSASYRTAEAIGGKRKIAKAGSFTLVVQAQGHAHSQRREK